MDAQSLSQSVNAWDQGLMLVLLLIFLPIFFFANWAVKRGAQITLRPIAAYDTLKALLGQAAEAGRPVHLSLGIAGIGDQATADTMAGLTVLDYIADRAAVSASPPIVTLANPTVLPVAQDVLRRAYRRQGVPEEYDPTRARLVAPQPTLVPEPTPGSPYSPNPALYAPGQRDGFAYAAGTMRMLNQQALIANVMVGRFGDEFLLLAETGAQRNLNQMGGTSQTSVLPFVYTSVANPLIGEEIYAGGAYLSNRPEHVGSLAAQDAMRWLLIALLLFGMLLKTIGLI